MRLRLHPDPAAPGALYTYTPTLYPSLSDPGERCLARFMQPAEGDSCSAAPTSVHAAQGADPAVPRVLFVCSSGGHLVQLLKLRPWWQGVDRLWVTFPGTATDSLLRGEEVVAAHHPTTRNVFNAVRNGWLAGRVLRAYRPDVVISTGAGVAVPFFVMAKTLGMRTLYLEVYDRIDRPTLTGRLCYHFSDLFLLQWEEQQRCYPKGRVIGTVL
jgi:hypothetical protein